MNRILMPLAEWLEMFVLWIAAIIATLALLLSGHNTYTLHMLRRELEALREERRESAESPGARREGGRFEQTPNAILIRGLRAVNFGFDHQTFRVYQQVPLPAAHLLATIEAPLLTADAGCLHRLAVHDARARLGVPAEFLPQLPPHRPVHLLPGSIYPPRPEVVKHRLPRRELAREHAPRATALQDIQDCVKDLARAVDARASSSLWDWEVRLQHRPFGVGEVCGVSLARHVSDRTRSTDAFSDSLFYELR
jgi:hypothetical protein